MDKYINFHQTKKMSLRYPFLGMTGICLKENQSSAKLKIKYNKIKILTNGDFELIKSKFDWFSWSTKAFLESWEVIRSQPKFRKKQSGVNMALQGESRANILQLENINQTSKKTFFKRRNTMQRKTNLDRSKRLTARKHVPKQAVYQQQYENQNERQDQFDQHFRKRVSSGHRKCGGNKHKRSAERRNGFVKRHQVVLWGRVHSERKERRQH